MPSPQPDDDIRQFEERALGVLESSENYDSGVQSLSELYSGLSDETKAKTADILADYGDGLSYKHKSPYFSLDETLDIAPAKPTVSEGASKDEKVAAINAWEAENKKISDDRTGDPLTIIGSGRLKRSVDSLAAEARRDILGRPEKGDNETLAYVADKFYRFADGVIGAPAKALGMDSVVEGIRERTNPENDAGFVAPLASGAGQVAGVISAGVAGGVVGSITGLAGMAAGAAIGSGAYLAGQAIGAIKETYEASIENTGDTDRAQRAAALEAGAQAIGVIPVGRIGAAGVKAVVKEGMQEVAEAGLKGIVKEVSKDSALEAVSQVGSNIATGVGQNKDINYLEGTGTAAGVSAILGGTVRGAGLLRANYSEEVRQKRELAQQDVDKNAADILVAKEALKTASMDPLVQREVQSQRSTTDKESITPDGELLNYNKDPDGIYTEEEYSAARDVDNLQEKYGNTDTETVDLGNAPLQTGPIEPNVEIDGENFFNKDNASNARPILTSPGSLETYTPGRFALTLAKVMGTTVTFKDKLPGMFGVYYGVKNKIEVVKSLGADPKKLLGTVAHEIGHAIDFLYAVDAGKYYSRASLSTINKLRNLKTGISAIYTQVSNPAFNSEAARLSSEWRPGWDGVSNNTPHEQYRSDPAEVVADVLSAMINNPEYVKNNFPDIYNTVEQGAATDPTIAEGFDAILEFHRDPEKGLDLLNSMKEADRTRQGEIERQKRVNDRLRDPSLIRKGKEALSSLYRLLVKNTDFIVKALNEAKTKGEQSIHRALLDALHYIAKSDDVFIRDQIIKNLELPVQKGIKRLAEVGISINTWGQFEWVNKLENETTRTIENIRENPELYFDIAEVVADMEVTLPSGQKVKFDYNGSLRTAIQKHDVEALIEAFAQSRINRSTISPYKLSDYYAKHKQTGEGRKKALQEFNRDTAAYLKDNRINKEFVTELKNIFDSAKLSGAKDTTKIFESLLTDGAFNIRRFLVNPNMETVFDSRAMLDRLTKDFTPEQMEILKNVSKEFHEGISNIFPLMKDSGILSPEMLDRIELNKDSYTTNFVLKYFEGDDSISANFRKALGSAEATGNEIASTNIKMKAITYRAIKQAAQNFLVDAAIATNQAEKIKGKPNSNIFAERALKASTDRENTYVIKYEDGIPSLYKLEGKGWGDALYKYNYENSKMLRVVSEMVTAFDTITLNKSLKTVLSPIFFINQKFVERSNEASYTKEISFVPGLAPKRGKARSKANSLIRTAYTTGNLEGFYKEAIDNNAMTEEYNGQIADSHYSAAEMLYTSQGTDLGLPKNLLTIRERARLGLRKLQGKAAESIPDEALRLLSYFNLSEYIRIDETKTKLTGYIIGREQGMSPKEAAEFTRSRFGTPMGGGTMQRPINDAFLFGRAHMNGLANIGAVLKTANTPGSALTIGANILAPRIITSAAIMGPVLAYLVGDDEAKKYLSVIDRIPSWEKLSKFIIPVGMTDSKGNFRHLGDFSTKEIKSDWKAAFLTVPQSREMTALASITWPSFEEVLQGDIQDSLAKTLSGVGSVSAGSLHPLIKHMYNVINVSAGGTGKDFFRQKNILTKEEQDGLSLPEKLAILAKYEASGYIPSVIPKDAYETRDTTVKKSGIDKFLSETPVAGPLGKTFIRVSNYGLVEQDAAKKQELDELEAHIHMSLSDSTKTMFNLSKKAEVIAKTNEQKANLSKEQLKESVTAARWRSMVYRPSIDAMVEATESGNQKKFDKIKKRLDADSQRIFSRLLPKPAPSSNNQ